MINANADGGPYGLEVLRGVQENIRIACGRQLVVTRDEEKEEGGTWQRLGLMYRQRRYGQ